MPLGTALAYDSHLLHVIVISCPPHPVNRKMILYTQKLRTDACNAGQKGRSEHPTTSVSHHARLQSEQSGQDPARPAVQVRAQYQFLHLNKLSYLSPCCNQSTAVGRQSAKAKAAAKAEAKAKHDVLCIRHLQSSCLTRPADQDRGLSCRSA